MPQIITSTYTQDAHAQQDGSVYTTERHTDELGRVISIGPYLCAPNMNPQTVMELRAERMNAEFAARAAEQAEAANGKTPWSKLEFRDQLGDAQVGMDAFFATFESNPNLTDVQKASIRTGWRRYQEAHYIARPLLPEVVQMLGLLQSLGLITAERVAEIVAAGAA